MIFEFTGGGFKDYIDPLTRDIMLSEFEEDLMDEGLSKKEAHEVRLRMEEEIFNS